MADRLIHLAPDDDRLVWQGAVALQRRDGWVQPWRLPYTERALFPPEELRARAAMPAGVRIAFASDTDIVAGEIVPDPEMARLDLCCDGAVYGSVDLAGKEQFTFSGLPPGRKRIELWLPQFGVFRLRSLSVAAGAAVALIEDACPRWITYGSSITQCRTAASPTGTWPAIVAHAHGLYLTCLGFGGQCHLDPMIARLIRDLPADYLSICVGINIYGAASLSTRTLGPALIGFIRTIRERHPQTPFAVVSPIYSGPRETNPNAVGLTLQAIREEVAEAVALLRAAGDGNLRYVNGLDLLGVDAAHLMPDDLHPDAEGYRLLARRFLEQVARPVFGASPRRESRR
jgi:hypothetical protein